MPLRPALIALGGVLGVLIRWGVVDQAGTHRTTAVLGLNIVGSVLIGVLAGRDRGRGPMWSFSAIGFCGGLTTFSTFAVEVARRLDDGEFGGAISLLVLTVIFATIAAGVGYRIGAQSIPSATVSTTPEDSTDSSRRARP